MISKGKSWISSAISSVPFGWLLNSIVPLETWPVNLVFPNIPCFLFSRKDLVFLRLNSSFQNVWKKAAGIWSGRIYRFQQLPSFADIIISRYFRDSSNSFLDLPHKITETNIRKAEIVPFLQKARKQQRKHEKTVLDAVEQGNLQADNSKKHTCVRMSLRCKYELLSRTNQLRELVTALFQK